LKYKVKELCQLYQNSGAKRHHNPGPDRSPIRYIQKGRFAIMYRGDINIRGRVAPGRALGTLDHLSL